MNLDLERDKGTRMQFLTPGEGAGSGDAQEVGFTDETSKLLRLSGVVSLESRLSVSCAGAVLAYLQRRRVADYLPRDLSITQAFRVVSVEAFGLKDMMYEVSARN